MSKKKLILYYTFGREEEIYFFFFFFFNKLKNVFWVEQFVNFPFCFKQLTCNVNFEIWRLIDFRIDCIGTIQKYI